ncbi:MAG: hypothetical protein WC881_11985, partial [Elusimicrobiota bacterium]
TVSYNNVPVGSRMRLSVDGPSDIGVGSLAVDGSGAPWQSIEARTQFDFWANPYANPAYQYYAAPSTVPMPSGGYYAGLYATSGQILRVESSGTWSYDGGAGHGPGGSGLAGGLIAGNNRGALVGRIGSGGWFLLGANSTTTVAQSGDLYLAMSDDDYSNNAGSVSVRFYIQASTAAKTWVGGYPGFETKADMAANWTNGKPFSGDHVVFAGSAYDCDWDLPNLSLSLLEMTTAYTRTLRLSNVGGAYNTLNVTGGASIERGRLMLGYRNRLTVPGQLLIQSSATLDLGMGAQLQAGSLRLSGGSYLTGYVPTAYDRSMLSNPPGLSSWQFRIEDATVSLSGFGPELHNAGLIDVGAAAHIAGFDNILVGGSFVAPEPSLRLHSDVPVTRTFSGWQFEAAVSTNVDASDVAPGSNLTFVSASGPRMGSPYERDAKNVLNWSPDGGGQASIAGSVSGGSFDTYYVYATTDPAGGYADMSLRMSTGGAPTAFTLSGLRAPATYYLFGFRSNTASPIAYGPRGGYGHDGSWLSEPIFLAAGGAAAGKDILVSAWSQAQGFANMNTAQIGKVRVQAYWGDPASAGAALQAQTVAAQYTPYFWSLDLPPATYYYFRAYVDLNDNGAYDYFEASGSSAAVNVPPGLTYDVGNIPVAGGSAGLGGTVWVATMTGHSGNLRSGYDEPMLKLTLTAADLDAHLSGINIGYSGDIPPGGVSLRVYSDENNDGILDTAWDNQRGSAWLSYGSGVSSSTIQFWNPLPLPVGQSRTLFLSVANYNTGSSRIVVESTASFALSAGSMADQKFYPVDSGWAQVKRMVWASNQADPGNIGGYWTGFHVYAGQTMNVSASGVWYSSAGAAGSGPGGVPGTSGQNTVLTSTNVGTLIGRINSYNYTAVSAQPDGNWFAVGGGTLGHSVQTSGELVLAMNDIVGAYYDN